MLAVNVLGPFQVEVEGRPVPLAAGRLRTLLVGLAMSAGRMVSVHQLTEIVWGDKPPVDPRRSLQTYAARLRGALGTPTLETHPTGLRLRADPQDVDALRFVRLLEDAARTTDSGSERAQLAEALSLWRGEPLEDVSSDRLRRTEYPRLVERYLTGFERLIDIDIRNGAHESLTAELEHLTARYPLRESLWARLLVVLDRRGRPAEAVQRYEDVRRRIADELGTDPSPELQRLHAKLLARGHRNRPASVIRG
ncbi:AfsR/SARP family transcriptional regulator [Actinophytocola xanthii]|uniref:AfsR/SARP family transcriptional regulator n=1 Tax=Actinophytocola xanthii TaxID=1912961 RepID=UPI0013016256|nr:AfsR/SARP family transcriptional regulator [Actinophytocola xanthii]